MCHCMCDGLRVIDDSDGDKARKHGRSGENNIARLIRNLTEMYGTVVRTELRDRKNNA